MHGLPSPAAGSDPSSTEGLPVVTPALPVCPLTVCAWRLGSLTLTNLWAEYLILGGTADRQALTAYLDGTASWLAREHNILAHTLNEHLWDLGLPNLAPMRQQAGWAAR
jgi:hypothetical protein